MLPTLEVRPLDRESAAELLDVEGLRIVKYLPGNGEVSSEAAE